MASGVSSLGSQLEGVKCPVGYSAFRREMGNPPKVWSDRLGIVQWYKTQDQCGHFAALEQPEALWEDIEESLGHVNIEQPTRLDQCGYVNLWDDASFLTAKRKEMSLNSIAWTSCPL
ncbi:hypothetical protein NW752_010890 [Fusarium irregulare]|nr:hypothetical protein NW752_010890 [Fusarium irregulare]